MAVIENLDIVLGARTTKFDRGLDRSTARAKQFESDVNRIGAAANAAFAPLATIASNLITIIPGATAAATAFNAVAAAFAATAPAKIATRTKETAKHTRDAADAMADFHREAKKAAETVQGTSPSRSLVPRRSRPVRYGPTVPKIGSRALSTRRRKPADDIIDAEFTVVSNVPVRATKSAQAATGAMRGMSAAGIAGGAAVAGAIVGVAAAGTAAVITLNNIRDQMGQIDDIAKSAATANVTFRELAGFRLLTEESTGKGPEVADKALQKLQIRLSEAQRNGGALADQLKSAGLDAGQLLRAGPIAAMEQLSAATQQMKSPTDQLLLAYRLFEEEGAAFVSTLRGGPAAIQDSIVAADQLGLTLSQAQAKQVESANDAWGRTQQIMTGVFRQLAAETAPVFEVIADSINEFSVGFAGWQDYIRPAIDGLILAGGLVWDLGEAWHALTRTISSLLALDFDGAADIMRNAMDFGTGDRLLEKVNKARADAAAAASKPATGNLDLAAVQRQDDLMRAAADRQKQAAADRAREAAQNRKTVQDRLQGMRDEILLLKHGTAATERMKLARLGATAAQVQQFAMLQRQKDQMESAAEMRERGQALREQFATPAQQMQTEWQGLFRLFRAGAIDYRTLQMASRDAATRLGKQETQRRQPTPTFGALQKGSVEAYSAGLRNERNAKQESLQQKANTLLENVNERLDSIRLQMANNQSIGNAG